MFGKTLPLKEKARAAGTFAGIALASVVALDFTLTNGWQIDPPPSQSLRVAEPSDAYIDMMDGGWTSDYSYSGVSWNEPMPIDDPVYQPEPVERLAGAPNLRDDEAYRTTVYNVPSEEQLYQEIAALYAAQEERAAERAEQIERRASELEAASREADEALAEELQEVEPVAAETYHYVANEPVPQPRTDLAGDAAPVSASEGE